MTKFVFFFLGCKTPRTSKGSSLDHSHVATEMKIGEKSSAKLKQALHLCIHVDLKRYYTESTWLHCTQIFPTPPLQGTLCHCNLKLARLDHFIIASSLHLNLKDRSNSASLPKLLHAAQCTQRKNDRISPSLHVGRQTFGLLNSSLDAGHGPSFQ